MFGPTPPFCINSRAIAGDVELRVKDASTADEGAIVKAPVIVSPVFLTAFVVPDRVVVPLNVTLPVTVPPYWRDTVSVNAAAMSDSVVFAQLDVISVWVTTGFPAGRVYLPVASRGMIVHLLNSLEDRVRAVLLLSLCRCAGELNSACSPHKPRYIREDIAHGRTLKSRNSLPRITQHRRQSLLRARATQSQDRLDQRCAGEAAERVSSNLCSRFTQGPSHRAGRICRRRATSLRSISRVLLLYK